jgi:Bacterial Ig domain/Cellulase (glycosyl hydrolase family 5)
MACLLFPWLACSASPIRLHPENGRYFLFRDRPTLLMGSSEHYGALLHLDFDYLRYLDETRACGLNLVRIFTGTYREMEGSFNIEDNTLAPPVARSVSPWKRTDIPGAADGGKKFDLNQWDPAYFHRLRDFVQKAGERGIVVELTFFSAIYDDSLWAISPMNSVNHINGVGASGRAAAYSPTGNLLPFQKALARKCATELRNADNVIYEICNEPYAGGISAEWEDQIIAELVATEAAFPEKHLIARNVFNGQGVITDPHPAVSLYNFHYAEPAAATANLGLGKALGDDETGFKGMEDFPYRSEAWEFLFAGGALFNHLDYSFTATREDGIATPSAPGGGGPAIRRQLGVLRWFLEEMPLTDLIPMPDLVTGGVPSGAAVSAIGAPGAAYGIYLRGGTQADLTLDLPAGTYRGRWIDTRSGGVVGAVSAFSHPGGSRVMESPPYAEDIALRLFAGAMPPPEVAITSPVYHRVVSGGLTVSADATAEGGSVASVEFFNGSASLGTVVAAPYQLALPGFAQGRHLLRAKVTTADGRVAFSQPVKVLAAGPYQSGVNLNGGSLTVNGDTLLSESAATQAGFVTTNSQPVTTSGNPVLYPLPDAPTTVMLQNQLLLDSSNPAAPLGLSQPLPNGTYDVFLFIVEGQTSYSRDMRVSLEGRNVANGIGDLAKGYWQKYGPYRTAVTDGVLDIALQRHTKGVPKIAGFSIYQAEAPIPFSEASLTITSAPGLALLTYPAGTPGLILESSDDLAAADPWEQVTDPAADFTVEMLVPVPVDRPKRFFRLRMD